MDPDDRQLGEVSRLAKAATACLDHQPDLLALRRRPLECSAILVNVPRITGTCTGDGQSRICGRYLAWKSAVA